MAHPNAYFIVMITYIHCPIIMHYIDTYILVQMILHRSTCCIFSLSGVCLVYEVSTRTLDASTDTTASFSRNDNNVGCFAVCTQRKACEQYLCFVTKASPITASALTWWRHCFCFSSSKCLMDLVRFALLHSRGHAFISVCLSERYVLVILARSQKSNSK